MTYLDTHVTSRVSGAILKAKLVTCDCGNKEFLIYFVEDHPHLQCVRCATTFCQSGQCSGAEELERSGN